MPSNLTLSWKGDTQLLFTEDLSAGFEVVAGATSPYTIKQGSMGFSSSEWNPERGVGVTIPTMTLALVYGQVDAVQIVLAGPSYM